MVSLNKMNRNFLWKIGGEAGFGIMVTGASLTRLAARSGYYAFDYAEYPSLIRGGHNTYEVVISENPVHMIQKEIDLLVCLNKDTYDNHKDRLSKSALVMHDADDFAITDSVSTIHIAF